MSILGRRNGIKGASADVPDAGVLVVCGNPTDEELAAVLVAVLTRLDTCRAGGAPHPERRWAATARLAPALPTGRGGASWRANAWT